MKLFKLSYSKLVKHSYMHSLLFKYLKRFRLTYSINEKCGKKMYDLLFLQMIKYSNPFSWDIDNVTGISDIVKPFREGEVKSM